MPDPARATISATQVAALFDESPYLTKWMLWHWLKGTFDGDIVEDERMEWGKLMQPLILDKVAEDLTFEVHPNATDAYMAFNEDLIGCTRDAEIICPDRGPGALEIKCVFDYRQWMTAWGGGQGAPPRHVEMQLQIQMEVGDGKGNAYEWGVIAVWLAGQMYYFERKHDPKFAKRAHEEASRMFVSVTKDEEPDPFGNPREDDLVKLLWPRVTKEVQNIDDNLDLEEDARMFRWANDQRLSMEKVCKGLRPKLMAACGEFEETLMPGIRMKKKDTGKQIRFTVDTWEI